MSHVSASSAPVLRRDFLLEGDLAPLITPDSARPGGERPACCIAIGAFDGLHRGHRDLLDRTCADARSRGMAAVAVTFDPDPDVVVSSDPARKLLDGEDRIAALRRSGVDGVLVVPFDAEVAALDHAAFFDRFILPVLDVCAVHVGEDFRLGSGGRTDVETMRTWGEERGIEVFGHELVRDGGEAITATRIRGLVAEGDLDAVERELGRRYFVHGTVVRGRMQGASLGFPTANVELPDLVQRPREGVYAGWVFDGRAARPAAINVGIPPTFRGVDGAAELEANILGFSGDLYGAGLRILFTRFLRSQRAFGSVDELVSVVRGNIEDVRRLYGDGEVELVP